MIEQSDFIEHIATKFFYENKSEILAYIRRRVDCRFYKHSNKLKKQYLQELTRKVENCSDIWHIYQAHKVVLYSGSLGLMERIMDGKVSILQPAMVKKRAEWSYTI